MTTNTGNLVLAVALTWSSGMSAMETKSPTKTDTRSINHYDLDLPASYSLRDISPPMMDFVLYEIDKVGRTDEKLVLYFGSAPSFPALKWSTPAIKRSKGRASITEFPYSQKERQMEGLVSVTGLMYHGRDSPFSYVHYIATGLDERDARDFEEIVESIRVERPTIDRKDCR